MSRRDIIPVIAVLLMLLMLIVTGGNCMFEISDLQRHFCWSGTPLMGKTPPIAKPEPDD
jgi:hypothetical protein